MDRRRFIIKAGQAFPIVAGAVYAIGCDSYSDDAGNGNGSGNGNGNGNNAMTIVAVSSVNAGHSHRIEFPEADLSGTSSKSYRSSSSGGHIHTVVLSQAQLMTIQDGGSVTVTSSNDAGHTHQFTFSRST